MICIRYSIVAKWAEKRRMAFTTYSDLASRPEVYALLRQEVEAVNASLPPGQRIAKFLLLYKELDADDGELTRTRKVRRSVIGEKYDDIIEAIYAGQSRHRRRHRSSASRTARPSASAPPLAVDTSRRATRRRRCGAE